MGEDTKVVVIEVGKGNKEVIEATKVMNEAVGSVLKVERPLEETYDNLKALSELVEKYGDYSMYNHSKGNQKNTKRTRDMSIDEFMKDTRKITRGR